MLKGIGFGALAILVIAWIAVSFLGPGRRRSLLEWIGATAGFAALSTFFVSLFLRAWEADVLAGIIGFGLLCFLFLTGLAVSTAKTILEAIGRRGSGTSATN